ncbi:MAG: UxaA family hydrolase [Alphaproteobacteria bacterium]|nr:UxaA family hydrolase [Alphaproteobacteria bacterium]
MSDTDPRLIRLAPEDNVLVAAQRIESGEAVRVEGCDVTLAKALPLGYKLAARAIAAGEKILKYGAPLGSASQAIALGEVVHVHNLRSDYIPSYDREGEGAFKG